MTPQLVVLLLRLLIGLALYIFLAALLLTIWRDLTRARPEVDAFPQAVLAFQMGERELIVSLVATNLIGRAPDNTVVLQDETISARHARITYTAGQWILEDLGSKNGTYVNDLPLEQALVVTYGDRLTFGSLTALLMSGTPGSEHEAAG
jgi:pSer/pThr/pTyr-binding forkhead associated (FHA) protein